MKVEINIDPSQVGKTVEELFNSLPEEKRAEIAENLCKEWFKLPLTAERDVAVGKLLREHNATKFEDLPYYVKNSFGRNFESSRETFLKKVIGEATATVNSNLEAKLKEDPVFQSLIENTLKVLQENLPLLIQNAFNHAASSHLAGQLGLFDLFTRQSQDAFNLSRAVAQRVGMDPNNHNPNGY